MFDIYSFIEPKETADYCRSLGQTWNPFEMAVIIGRSSRSLFEKHAAWKQLMSDYPDMPTYRNFRNPSYESFHKELAEYMNHQNRVLALLKKQEHGASYKWYFRTDEIGEEYEEGRQYCSEKQHETFEGAWEELWSVSESLPVINICIEKYYQGEKHFSMLGTFDTEGNSYHVFAKARDLAKYTNEAWRRPVGLFGRTSNGFCVYIPWKNLMLTEDERALFYNILLVVDEWNPLEHPYPSSDEYISEARELFEILNKNENVNELDEYFNKLFDENLEHLEQNKETFLKKANEAKMRLLECMEGKYD